jgi:hypothetical protein
MGGSNYLEMNMKKLLLIAAFSLLTSACATDKKVTMTPPAAEPTMRKVAQTEVVCATGVDAITKQIAAAKTCREAIDIYSSCAYGSSVDPQFVMEAQTVCYAKEMKKITRADKRMIKKMEDRCNGMCNRETDGTMCTAIKAGCRMEATEFFLQFYVELEN